MAGLAKAAFGKGAILDFLAKQLSTLNIQGNVLGDDAKNINAQFSAQLQGTRAIGAIGRPGNQLILLVADRWSPNLTGSVHGIVSWNKGASGPPDCGTLGFYSEIQSGPAPVINWDTKETGPAPTARYYASFATYSDADAGTGTSSCSYGIDKVPANVPNTITAGTLRGGKECIAIRQLHAGIGSKATGCCSRSERRSQFCAGKWHCERRREQGSDRSRS